jgi:hypothetical protein
MIYLFLLGLLGRGSDKYYNAQVGSRQIDQSTILSITIRMAPTPVSDIVTADLLDQLKNLYPIDPENEESHPNPWDIVAAVAFTGSNLPEAVPIVYQHALNDLRHRQAQDHPEGKTQEEVDADELLLVRRIKDAIFKAGITFGYPRVRLTHLLLDR